MKTPPARSQSGSVPRALSVSVPSRRKRNRLRSTNRLHTEVVWYRVDEALNLQPVQADPNVLPAKPSCRFSLLIKGNAQENGEAAFQVLHCGEALDWARIESSLLHLLKDLLGKLLGLSTEEQHQLMFLRQLRTYILENLQTEGFGIDALSRCAGYSAAHLTRLIEKSARVHPTTFIHQVRIEAACRLLRTTGKRVNEVAYAVGYEYPSNFCNKFKEMTGMTPNGYRISCRDQQL